MGFPQSNIDWSKYMKGLEGKANTTLDNISSGKDIVVEYNANPDGSWYRKYKSGWLEQGGMIKPNTHDINYLKPFENTNYVILFVPTNNGDFTSQRVIQTNSRTTTKCRTTSDVPSTSFGQWYACGQGA